MPCRRTKPSRNRHTHLRHTLVRVCTFLSLEKLGTQPRLWQGPTKYYRNLVHTTTKRTQWHLLAIGWTPVHTDQETHMCPFATHTSTGCISRFRTHRWIVREQTLFELSDIIWYRYLMLRQSEVGELFATSSSLQDVFSRPDSTSWDTARTEITDLRCMVYMFPYTSE